jgi:hypothetical protein
MKTVTPVGLVLLLTGVVTYAADPRPRLVVEETVFDFGSVDQGARVEHTFRLPNRGDGVLHVDHVKSSCGCTVAVVSDRVVPPGDEARVAVAFDTSRVTGRTTKTISVYTDDPDAPVLALSLSGQVAADFVVTPTPLYLGRIRRGESVRREVTITPGRDGTTFAVERVETSHPALHARLEPNPDGGGQRLEVELERDVPLGRLNATLTLHTTSPGAPVLEIPVFASVEGDVVVLPPQVTFGVTRGSASERELVIRNRGARPVAITRVSVPDRVATYTLGTVEAGEEYRLTIRLREGLPPGKVEDAIEIFTDHPDEGRIVVPLYAIVRDGRRHASG